MIIISIPYGSKMIQVPSKDTFLWGMITGLSLFLRKYVDPKAHRDYQQPNVPVLKHQCCPLVNLTLFKIANL